MLRLTKKEKITDYVSFRILSRGIRKGITQILTYGGGNWILTKSPRVQCPWGRLLDSNPVTLTQLQSLVLCPNQPIVLVAEWSPCSFSTFTSKRLTITATTEVFLTLHTFLNSDWQCQNSEIGLSGKLTSIGPVEWGFPPSNSERTPRPCNFQSSVGVTTTDARHTLPCACNTSHVLHIKKNQTYNHPTSVSAEKPSQGTWE